jgi:hypothetical protein
MSIFVVDAEYELLRLKPCGSAEQRGDTGGIEMHLRNGRTVPHPWRSMNVKLDKPVYQSMR